MSESVLNIEKFEHGETGEIVEAVYFFEDKDQVPAIAAWCNGNVREGGRFDGELITIMTNGDIRCATDGHYIFKDSQGDFYPSEEEVFLDLYQLIREKED